MKSEHVFAGTVPLKHLPPHYPPLMRLLIFIALLPVACRREPAASAPSVPADAVATVGSGTLLKQDLAHAVSLSGNRPEGSVLRALADEEALAQMARAEGLADDPSVRAAIRRMLAARLREKRASTVTVSDEEVKAAIESAPAPPGRMHKRVAYLRQKFSEAGGAEAAAAKLREALTKFHPPSENPYRAGFGSLAVDYSDDNDTRYQGGDAGWIADGDRHVLLPAEVTSDVTSSQCCGLGQDVILSKDAAWLVLVADMKIPAPPVANLEQTRARLTAARQAAQEAALMEKARAAAPVKFLIPVPPDRVPESQPPAPPANP